MTLDVYENYTSTHGIDQSEALTTQNALIEFERHLYPHLPQNHDARILDLGCGYGKNLVALDKKGYTHAHGIDVSREQIEYGRNVLGLENLEVADALEYLEDKDHFDAIILADVIEHLPLDYAIALVQKICDALKAGGVLIIQTPNGLSPLCPYLYGDITHVRAFTPMSMSQILRYATFTSIQHHPSMPVVQGLKGLIRKILWTTVINPMVRFCVRVSVGSKMGNIYMPTLLTVAKKGNMFV